MRQKIHPAHQFDPPALNPKRAWCRLNSWYRRAARVGALSCALGLAATTAQAQPHSFSLLDGNTTTGELVAVQGRFVDIVNAAGKTFRSDYNAFCTADQAYIKAWTVEANKPKDAIANADSAIDAAITAETALESPVTGSSILLLPKVGLLNQESRQNFAGLKGTLILLGQEAGGSGALTVLQRYTFTFDLPAQGKFDFNGKPLPESAANPTSGNATYKYKGYVFVLQNAQNQNILFKSSGVSLKNADAALKLKAGTVYDPQFKPLR